VCAAIAKGEDEMDDYEEVTCDLVWEVRVQPPAFTNDVTHDMA
jgi:hypothetical protein